uniref:Small integral membrane protein 14 n=1 Tax=Globodera rostochiensis TaxID=31243 RepID=A0A914I4C6_GLORO
MFINFENEKSSKSLKFFKTQQKQEKQKQSSTKKRPKMSDPCECVFNHEAIMRRILSILQGIQTDCTDTECSTSAGGDPNAAAGSNILLIAMAWGVFAMLMFFMRPASMRSGGSERENGQLTEKPSSAAGAKNNNNDNNGNGPPPGDVF